MVLLNHTADPKPLAAKSENAFTFVEIIAVVSIIAIISTIIFSRVWFDNMDLAARVEVIKSHIRYAQSRSMSSDIVWGIHCDGFSYWLFKDGDTSRKIRLPGEESDAVNLENVSMESLSLSFDDRGIPHRDAPASDGMELTSSDPEAEITVSSAGKSRTIVITPNTGFIP